jgi:FixJ family two-component response regulator
MIMPGGMTGKDLAHTILQECPELKVIYMSGYSPEISGKDLQLQEGVNFLTKPFNATKLAESVRNSLDGVNQQPLEAIIFN